nr:hypothetical protein Q903MT_gene5916 [Picea sitchensis]
MNRNTLCLTNKENVSWSNTKAGRTQLLDACFIACLPTFVHQTPTGDCLLALTLDPAA